MRTNDILGFRKKLGESVVGGLGLESFFNILRGGVCGSVFARVFSLTMLTL
jgi:hypothetical protein